MEEYTIAEEYTLPSKGLVYEKQVNPNIKIRSMTTEEEMKRLGHSDRHYKLLSEIIDDCLVEKPGISSYDMCVGDYQFLLHRLRTVTYGPEYKISTMCPICGEQNDHVINLDELNVIQYSSELDKYLNLTLPKTGKHIKLRLQTPRMLDDIKIKSKELQTKTSSKESEPAILYTLVAVTELVDGEMLDVVKLESFYRTLPMMDTNYIIQNLSKINIGVDTNIECKCKACEYLYNAVLPIRGEFFGPTID